MAVVFQTKLIDTAAFLVRFETYWDRGAYLDPDGNEVAHFESVRTSDSGRPLWVATISDRDGRVEFRVLERSADPLHDHSTLDGKRKHHSYEVADPDDVSIGVIWARSGVLGGRWNLHLETSERKYELRARHRVADWNSDVALSELPFDLRGAHEGSATVTARWARSNWPTDNISVEMSDDLAGAIRSLLAAAPLCLPIIGLTGGVTVRTPLNGH
jgi:hypothetical protein